MRDGFILSSINQETKNMKIILENLTKRFSDRNRKIKEEITAVDQFNVEINDGELVCLLGPSGCGKSTVLNMISGLEKPTQGRVFFGDDDVTDLPPERRGIGMVFQSYALYPHMTVRENIRFPLENRRGKDRLSKAEMEKMVMESAKLLQIDQLMDRKPTEMSGGQQQRVAIARALVKKPRVLLMDEPLSNLDARLRLATREEIRRIQIETGITTVFVTHDQEEAMSISDHIILMKDGVKQQVGKPQEVYNNPINLFVSKFLGTPSINFFNAFIKNEMLYIGDEAVMETAGVADQNVISGIRPEGVIPDANGRFTVQVNRIEVLGRDTTLVAAHPSAQESAVRFVVSSEYSDLHKEKIALTLKPEKVFLFHPEKGERIRFNRKEGTGR